jgi:hypothetical protein
LGKWKNKMKDLFNKLIEKYEKNERLVENRIKREQLIIEKN